MAQALLRQLDGGSRGRRRVPDRRARRAARAGGDALVRRRARVFVGRDTRASGRRARAGVRARRRLGRRERRARRRAADPGRRAARARPRRGHLRLAQPARVQRRQVLRRRRAEARPTRRRRRSRRCSTPAASRAAAGSTASGSRPTATSSTCSSASAPTSPGCGSPSTARTARTPRLAPQAFEQLGAEVHAIGDDAGRDEHQRRLRRDRPARSATDVTSRGLRPRVAFDGDGDRMLAVDARRRTRSTATRSWRCSRSHLERRRSSR